MLERLRRWLWDRRAKLTLMVGSSVLSILTLEVAFRLGGVRGSYVPPRVDRVEPGPNGAKQRVPHGFIPGVNVVSRYSSDPRGYFGSDNSIEHRFNSVGWRDREHELAKPPGTLRILGLGDSYLYGQGVRHEDICLSRVERLLQPPAGKKLECINAGISAYNTGHQLELLRNRGLAYQPDIVILHFVLNDVEPDVYKKGPKVEFYMDYVRVQQDPGLLCRYSYLWSWVRDRYFRASSARKYIRECVDSFSPQSDKWSQCRTALDGIHRLCTERKIPLLVVIFPFFIDLDGDYPFQPIHEVVRGHCDKQGIPVLDLRNTYRGFHGPELWVHPTDQHPNEKAHELAATAIVAFLRERAKQFGLQ
ncbi:MAG: SGNH/GDSL hydrolase family protein [Planctomycetes bacterium]|nr:SGNH/GDSL hydrolase family protein [Planctomycetota bacterium]MCB9889395.1 SGNH/GDSL hydrolase family protein [Planctomycetota bacterium]